MQKIVLYIKNNDDVYKRVDMFNDETISLTSKIQDVRDIQKVFTDFTQTFTLPASKTNNKLFQHWYNYNIDNGFDARNRKDAVMELDFSPFRRGKISLNNVKMKDNKPFSYEVIFYGNTINLKDLLGDDELGLLSSLDTYTHDYNNTNVKTGLQTSLSSGKIIYPLISHTKRFFYDSAPSAPFYNGNLHYNTTSNGIGLAFEDLKPAIKCMTIIEAIETKYNISFTRDFFNETSGSPFSNLFLWLSRNKGKIGGDENQEEILSRICKDWGYSSGMLGFIVTPDSWVISSRQDKRYEAELTITTTGGNTSIPYRIKAVDYVTGNVLAQSGLASGSFRDISFYILPSSQQINYQIKFIIESEETITFTPSLQLTQTSVNPLTGIPISVDGQSIYNINGTGDSINTTEEIIITENTPKIKNIDFLTGLFKMFNLTAYYIDDASDVDFGKIYVDTLDNFYADRINNPSEGSYDITKHIDTKDLTIERAFEYNQINFQYEKPSTLLSVNHQEQFNEIFGNEEVKPTFVDRGTKYEVKVPFEHMKFERIIDDNKTGTSPYSSITSPSPYITDILWGYSADGDFESKTDVSPATGNYSPVLTKPLVFYAIQETGLSSGTGIKWISDGTPIEITQYNRPSNTNEDGTTSTAPAFTINFDDEIDEWNLTNYSTNGLTNSLFKKFYANYINGIFEEKKRIYKLKGYLPTDILANYRLNDELVIQDRTFTINSISTNFKTEVSELELLNKL